MSTQRADAICAKRGGAVEYQGIEQRTPHDAANVWGMTQEVYSVSAPILTPGSDLRKSYKKKHKSLKRYTLRIALRDGGWFCHYCGIRLDPQAKTLPYVRDEHRYFGLDRCGLPVDFVQVDHIVPVARGGGHEIDNLVLCCPYCNSFKRAMPYEEAMRKIRSIYPDPIILDPRKRA